MNDCWLKAGSGQMVTAGEIFTEKGTGFVRFQQVPLAGLSFLERSQNDNPK